MKNYKCVVKYDGTEYCGYQKQKAQPTIQETLEQAIEKVFGSRITVYASGRTDSGVHATGQVINFHAEQNVPVLRIPFALNSVLPSDIVIETAEEVDSSFHARYSAVSKTYEYYILNRKIPCPFRKRYSLHVPICLDIDAMKQAAKDLRGTHDFAALQAAGSSVQSTVRTITYSQIDNNDDMIIYTVTADGFLYNMVRIIVGTLLEVGRKKITPVSMSHILKSKNRELAGATVPAQGLFLTEVMYSTENGST